MIRNQKSYSGELLKMLKTNPTIRLEVQGHTDRGKGNVKKNLKLSKQRAGGVVSFLVKKGIAKNRLRAKGYGNTQPVIEAQKANKENRRIEFLVLQN